MAKDRSQPRSQFPGPLVAAEPVRSAGAASVSPQAPKRTRAERVGDLLALLVAALGDAEVAFLSGMLSDEGACKLGASRNPQDVCDDLVDAMTALAPSVTAGKLPGYGPLRARFAADIAHALTASLDDYEAAGEGVRVASMQAARAMELTGPMRAWALHALASVLVGIPELGDRLRALTPSGDGADAGIDALAKLSELVRDVRQRVPESMLADAGLTKPVLDALAATSRDASAARRRHRWERGAKQRMRAELAAPVGRLVFELRALLAAAKVARRKDPRVPTFTTPIVHRAAKRRAPPTPPTPPNG